MKLINFIYVVGFKVDVRLAVVEEGVDELEVVVGEELFGVVETSEGLEVVVGAGVVDGEELRGVVETSEGLEVVVGAGVVDGEELLGVSEAVEGVVVDGAFVVVHL
uniref:Uncharacterized protein n=1 Tax=Strongyloides papillosus TaxID=174720 RepID=A0A0N5BGL0_STREA